MSKPNGIEAYEKILPPGTAAISISGKGRCYFRRPTQEEWDELQGLSDEGGEQARIAFKRLVSACFVGAYTPLQGELTLDGVCKLEGPAFITGPAGFAVNELAGVGKRPLKFLAG